MEQRTIHLVIATLNKIEVKGKDNLDMLLGCINVLEKLAADKTNEEQKEESTNDGK